MRLRIRVPWRAPAEAFGDTPTAGEGLINEEGQVEDLKRTSTLSHKEGDGLPDQDDGEDQNDSSTDFAENVGDRCMRTVIISQNGPGNTKGNACGEDETIDMAIS